MASRDVPLSGGSVSQVYIYLNFCAESSLAQKSHSDRNFRFQVFYFCAKPDRDIKIPLYAEAAIPEVWLVNLPQETIEIYARPVGDAYREIEIVKRDESLAAKSIAHLSIDANAVLGQAI